MENLRIKRFLTEIRYSPTFIVNQNTWNIAENFKSDFSGIACIPNGGIGIIKKDIYTEYEAEAHRASFFRENVVNIEEAINNSSEYLEFLINNYKIDLLKRLGVRVFYLTYNKQTSIQYYANLLANLLSFDKQKMFNSELDNGGIILRFNESKKAIRLGIFASNEEVMKKYHRYNDGDKVKEFIRDGIIFDIDVSRETIMTQKKEMIKGFRPKKFNIYNEVKDSYDLSMQILEKFMSKIEETK